jgi:hypothetical protein
MCDGFLNKKNQGGCPDCPERNARRSGLESFCRSFFLLLKERKRITVTFFIFFVCFLIKFCKLN